MNKPKHVTKANLEGFYLPDCSVTPTVSQFDPYAT